MRKIAVLPLVWKNGWPKAGEKIKNGVYEIQSERRGYALEIATDFVRIPQDRQAWWKINPDDPVKKLEFQKLTDVEKNWKSGDIETINHAIFVTTQLANMRPVHVMLFDKLFQLR